MKLYNILKNLILEETEKHLLTESVSMEDIKSAIDNKFTVNILYRDFNNAPPSKRYIQVYNLSKTKAGNYAIRAYQITGGSKRNQKYGFWKIFRLDRIEGWYPTKFKWVKPISDLDNTIPKYNKNGDKSMSQVIHKIKTT
jgi:predicted DNA-binding transcriptional regulator YafY